MYTICMCKMRPSKIKYLGPPLPLRSAPSHPHPFQTMGGKTDVLK